MRKPDLAAMRRWRTPWRGALRDRAGSSGRAGSGRPLPDQRRSPVPCSPSADRDAAGPRRRRPGQPATLDFVDIGAGRGELLAARARPARHDAARTARPGRGRDGAAARPDLDPRSAGPDATRRGHRPGRRRASGWTTYRWTSSTDAAGYLALPWWTTAGAESPGGLLDQRRPGLARRAGGRTGDGPRSAHPRRRLGRRWSAGSRPGSRSPSTTATCSRTGRRSAR